MEFHIIINGIPVDAHYSCESVDGIFIPLLRKLSELQKSAGRRILVMLAAPPGAGKSTLCEFLKTLSGSDKSLPALTVIGMDGFHRYQDYLLTHTAFRDGREVRMVDIKGAPVTFDLHRFTEFIKKVSMGEECGWPVYNRMTHNPQEDAVKVTGDVVILEGNYLLLDEDGWRELHSYADFTVKIIADIEDLRTRLVERKCASGTDRASAEEFVERSDLYNARLCLSCSLPADLTLYMRPSGEYALTPEMK